MLFSPLLIPEDNPGVFTLLLYNKFNREERAKGVDSKVLPKEVLGAHFDER